MRYPTAHKESTRRRIVQAAAHTIRERGVVDAGVDEIMRRAGLTHGGFYAHFSDKDALVSAACTDAFAAAAPNLERIAAGSTPATRARLLINSYLAHRHRDNPGSGCLVAAIGAEFPRLGAGVRTGCSKALARHLESLAKALRLESDRERNFQRVTLLISSLVGALLIARAIEDPVQSADLLRSIRSQLREQFCGVAASPAAPRRSARSEPSHDFMRAF